MATKKSAGILLYRMRENEPEFFLVHPGGPYWKKKDLGSWSISKGEFEDEAPELAAKREFLEETGHRVFAELLFLGTSKMKSGKIIYGFAAEQDIDELSLRSNQFPLEWPPWSGKKIMVPEVDRGGWFNLEEARKKIHPAQVIFLDQLFHKLSSR